MRALSFRLICWIIISTVIIYPFAYAQDDRGELIADLLTDIENLRYEIKILRDENEYLRRDFGILRKQNKEIIESIERYFKKTHASRPRRTTPVVIEDQFVIESQEEEPEESSVTSPQAKVSEQMITEEKSATTPVESKLHIPSTTSLVIPDTDSTDIQDGDEEIAYENIIQYLNEGQFNLARNHLREFVETYQSSQYAPRFNYLLGEIYYDEENYSSALQYFRYVFIQFPNSKIADDARLMTAYVYYEQQNWKDAHIAFEALTDSKNLDVKRQARENIKLIKQEGRLDGQASQDN